jgi:methyl-accepting chemotaxis protein
MKLIVKAFALFVLAGILGIYLIGPQRIADWLAYRSYEPPQEISVMVSATGMSDEGEFYFYASQPQLNNKDSFNANCPFPEKNLVLGCYSDRLIYIFDVNDQRIPQVEEITAAHEMLHAVYERLSDGERESIDKLIMEAASKIEDENLSETIALYDSDGPGVVENELHSILGTEYGDLPPELEEHYGKYFDNRDAVIALSDEYRKVFDSVQAKITKMDKQITNLRKAINSLEKTLESKSKSINNESARLDTLLRQDKIAQYNAGVPAYNASIAEFNRLVEQYRQEVADYNKLVDRRNKIALEQNSLVQSLDSKFSSIDNN